MSRPIARRPIKRRFIAAAALCAAANPVSAQLATSPGPEEISLPGVEVTNDSGEKVSRKRPPRAPSAEQQSSTPRSTDTKSSSKTEEAPGSGNGSGTSVQSSPDNSDVSVSPTGVTTNVDQIANSVSVVTSKEIAAQQRRTVTDVLRMLPGINVVQEGGPGARTSVFIRGTNSNHVKVYVDGIDVTDPGANRLFDFGQLQTFDIDRVELLRGPQSGLYGADAMGGVIAIYTKKGEGPPKFDAVVEGGSFGTFNQAAGVRGSSGAFNYSFNVAHQRVDDVPVTPRDYLPAGTRRFGNSWDNWTYSTKLGYDITPDVSVNVVARYIDSELKFTGDGFDFMTFNSIPNDFQSRTDMGQLHTRAETVIRSFGGAMTSYFGINYSDIDTDNYTPDPFFPQAGLNNSERLRVDWRSVLEIGPGYTLVAGADWQNEKIDNVDVNPFSRTPLKAEEDNTGVFTQLNAEVIRNWFVTGNLRYDDNENFGDTTTWRAASAYLIELTGTKLKGSYGTAFKAPSLNQRFQDFPPTYFGNPNLQPEENKGYDLGFEQAIINGKVLFGATYFHNDITQLIQFTSDPSTGIGTLINIGSAQTKGVEAFASADVTEDIRLRVDYTYTESRNEDTDTALLRRPRHKASLTAGWTPIDDLLLSSTLLYVGETLDIDRATSLNVTLPSYFLVNVAADYRLNQNMSLFGRIDNLFDEHYENPDGFLGPSLAAYGGLRFRN